MQTTAAYARADLTQLREFAMRGLLHHPRPIQVPFGKSAPIEQCPVGAEAPLLPNDRPVALPSAQRKIPAEAGKVCRGELQFRECGQTNNRDLFIAQFQQINITDCAEGDSLRYLFANLLQRMDGFRESQQAFVLR